ncbi:LuxR family transcriptional regulator [Govanella unica]|uniref:LuxR family transcriptional regulator n=1 Tax=Govanella unica TaxID=2975056 RepID=A0A9X3TYF2_9PROT|nr:LuxR family transcriptional regulator [Govania unica]MDA5193687.1 LuxR family transcriptional regulator [Govania unica]
MHPFDVAQEFIEICEPGQTRDTLATAFVRAIETLGFSHFALCSHVDPLAPPDGAVVLLNYPPSWVEMFSARKLERIDPIFRHADRTARPFFWNESAFHNSLTPLQRDILAEAASLGLSQGYTIPLHAPMALPASCSLVPDSLHIDAASYSAARLMAAYLHETLMPVVEHALPETRLSRRERQCLELAGQGKSDWIIGQILGISERTAHNHMERAKQRLGVASRTQAVVEALFQHHISFGDVIRVKTKSPRAPRLD